MLDKLRLWVAEKIVPDHWSVSLGISPRVDPSGALAMIGGRSTAAGVRVNPGVALGIAAFWACVNLYASTIAALDLEVVDRDERGGFKPARDDPRYDLLNARPNRTTPRVNFWQAILGHALTYPGGFAEIEWSARGLQPLGLHLMDPRSTRPVVHPDRTVEYEHGPGAAKDRLPAADVVHIRGLGWDGIGGYSRVEQAAEMLGVAKAQLVYEGAIYGNGAQASGFIELPGASPGADKLRDMRGEIEQVHGGSAKAGKFGFLFGGAKWVATSYSPADARLNESQKAKALEIARLMNVPPHMIGIMDGATVGNAEEQAQQFIKFHLLPWLKGIEGELNLKLFSPQERRRGLCVRHDTRSLERGNMAARMAYWEKRVQLGSASPNMVALAEGDEAFDDPAADDRYLPTNNLQSLREIGMGPTQPASNTPEEPDADDNADDAGP